MGLTGLDQPGQARVVIRQPHPPAFSTPTSRSWLRYPIDVVGNPRNHVERSDRHEQHDIQVEEDLVSRSRFLLELAIRE